MRIDAFSKGAVMKEKIMPYFRKTQMVTLATCEGDQPRLRPMTLIVKDDRFFFATGSNDNKGKQLAENPKAEFCLTISNDANSGYLRGSGKMVAVKDEPTRKEIADWSEFIYNYWQDPTDPDYCLYEMLITQTRFMKPGEMQEVILEWQQHAVEGFIVKTSS